MTSIQRVKPLLCEFKEIGETIRPLNSLSLVFNQFWYSSWVSIIPLADSSTIRKAPIASVRDTDSIITNLIRPQRYDFCTHAEIKKQPPGGDGRAVELSGSNSLA